MAFNTSFFLSRFVFIAFNCRVINNNYMVTRMNFLEYICKNKVFYNLPNWNTIQTNNPISAKKALEIETLL